MINTSTETATGKEYLVSDVIDSLKRLERVGSETSKTTQKLIQAADELSREICRHFDGFEDWSKIAEFNTRGTRYSYFVSRGKLYLNRSSKEHHIAYDRQNALCFSEHIADGLLEVIADTLERSGKDNETGLSVLVDEIQKLREKRGQMECLCAMDKEEFVAGLSSARSFWKRYRALVETEQLPEPYLSAENAIGGESEASDDPFKS